MRFLFTHGTLFTLGYSQSVPRHTKTAMPVSSRFKKVNNFSLQNLSKTFHYNERFKNCSKTKKKGLKMNCYCKIKACQKRGLEACSLLQRMSIWGAAWRSTVTPLLTSLDNRNHPDNEPRPSYTVLSPNARPQSTAHLKITR